MGLTERHWFENEDVPENYEWALEDDVYNSRTNKKPEDSVLKEQEAKTVESIQISRNFYAELTGYCPSCKRPLKDQFNKQFCGNCGQAVKWE